MILKHILLVGRESLLLEGLEKLLAKRAHQYVSRIDFTNTNILVQEIWRIQPGIVILNTLNLKHPLAVLAQLKSLPALKLIVVNEYNNDIVIFEHKDSPGILLNTSILKQQISSLN